MTPPGPPPFRYRAALTLWQAALRLGMPWIRGYFARRAEDDPAYGEHLSERRGEGAPFEADLWVHAVSMGEMRSARTLVELALDRGWKVVTTHATPAGRREAEWAFSGAIARGEMTVRYAPIDRIDWWRSFFRNTAPRAGLVMEMEFWPGMIEAARREGVPLILANAQVPSKSLPRARRVARYLGHPVASATAVWAKSDRMAARFRELGAPWVEALGETRFDITPPDYHLDAGEALRDALGDRPVVTFASVVEGEEATCLKAIADLRRLFPDLFVIWVPRAPEKFDDAAKRLEKAGLRTIRRSRALGPDLELPEGMGEADALLGDSLGEMFFYLVPADVVVVGGGFVPKGAHNVIEPLSLGKPVITGPHVWTIEFPAVEAEAAGVLDIVEPRELAAVVAEALTADATAAMSFHARHKGASARMIDRLEELLK